MGSDKGKGEGGGDEDVGAAEEDEALSGVVVVGGVGVSSGMVSLSKLSMSES